MTTETAKKRALQRAPGRQAHIPVPEALCPPPERAKDPLQGPRGPTTFFSSRAHTQLTVLRVINGSEGQLGFLRMASV